VRKINAYEKGEFEDKLTSKTSIHRYITTSVGGIVH